MGFRCCFANMELCYPVSLVVIMGNGMILCNIYVELCAIIGFQAAGLTSNEEETYCPLCLWPIFPICCCEFFFFLLLFSSFSSFFFFFLFLFWLHAQARLSTFAAPEQFDTLTMALMAIWTDNWPWNIKYYKTLRQIGFEKGRYVRLISSIQSFYVGTRWV